MGSWFRKDLGPSRWGRHDNGDKIISIWSSSRGEVCRGFSCRDSGSKDWGRKCSGLYFAKDLLLSCTESVLMNLIIYPQIEHLKTSTVPKVEDEDDTVFSLLLVTSPGS